MHINDNVCSVLIETVINILRMKNISTLNKIKITSMNLYNESKVVVSE
jgi:hypothetical protein